MNKHVWAAGLVGVVAAFVAVGCGDKSGGGASSSSASASAGKVASCNAPAGWSCKEYGPKNVEAAGMDFLKKLCSGMGEFKEAPCPTEKVVGVCSGPEGKSVSYEGGLSAAEAEKQCKDRGLTFSAK